MAAYNELIETSDDYIGYDKLLGEPLDINDASEPTDIIWENRHFTAWDRTQRTTVVVIIISALLFASFILLFYLSVIAQTAANKYPITQCNAKFNDQFSSEQAYWQTVKFEQKANAGKHNPVYQFTPCYCLKYAGKEDTVADHKT